MLVRHAPTSAAAVRQRLGADLAAAGVSEDAADEALLVASELLGNAIRHVGFGQLDVDWTITDAHVLVSVSDDSRREPEPREALPHETSGRGMTIVSALSSDWGVEQTPTGKRVWATVPLTRR
jgi:anti-sigma regulatory factor (Ser/Thr protein kinase)